MITELELAGLGLVGAGERSWFIAEQLAFQQITGYSGAIHFQEDTIGTGRRFMDQMRQDFFARATLAQQEYREVSTAPPAWPARAAPASEL